MSKLKTYSNKSGSVKLPNCLDNNAALSPTSSDTLPVDIAVSQLLPDCVDVKDEHKCDKMSIDLLSTMDNVRTDSGNSVNSREVPDSPASGTGSGKSRYGRAHKPKISEDFLPTDKKVGAILGLSPKQSNGTVNSPNIKEVRKKARKLFDNVHEKDGTDSKVVTKRKKGRLSLLPDIPQNHSTPLAIGETEKTTAAISTPLSTVVTHTEVSIPCDWVVGDLAWARVGRHPFWPCMVAIDPELHVFTKIKQIGRGTGLQKRALHVQFFGDNGRRSWVFANSVMRFKGRVSFNHEVERILSQIKKKYRKLTLAYSARESSRDKWEFAVKQAEGFLNRTREERIRYFAKHFPTKAAIIKSDNEASQGIKQKEKKIDNSSSSSTRKRKPSKSLEDSYARPQKLIKVEPGEPESPKRSVKKSASPVAKKSPSKRVAYKKKFGRRFRAFVAEHFSRIADEHPEMNKEGVEEYLRETWSEMAPNERARYHTTAGSSARDSSGLSSGDDNEDEEEGDERERSVIRNTASTSKKGGSLFRGFVREKVCQVCLKTGDTVKCKGPCLGVFHLSCNNNTVVKQEVLDIEEQSSINIKTETVTEQNGTPKGSSIHSEQPSNVIREESKDKLSCEPVSQVKSLSNDTATTSLSSLKDSFTGDNSGLILGGSETSQDKCDLNSGFRCKTCIEGRLPPCFACNSEKEPKTQCVTRQRCVIS